MEQIGWDYSNLKMPGKNVFLFRDNNHLDIEMQKRILEELISMINKKFFYCVFIEGDEGFYKPDYSDIVDEESLIMYAHSKIGTCPASDFLTYRLQKSMDDKIVVYGVDNFELAKKHRDAFKKLVHFFKLEEIRNLTDSEDRAYRDLFERHKRLIYERDLVAINTIDDKMREWRIETASVIFGALHCEGLCRGFQERGIGYAFYNPRFRKNNRKESIEYMGGWY